MSPALIFYRLKTLKKFPKRKVKDHKDQRLIIMDYKTICVCLTGVNKFWNEWNLYNFI